MKRRAVKRGIHLVVAVLCVVVVPPHICGSCRDVQLVKLGDRARAEARPGYTYRKMLLVRYTDTWYILKSSAEIKIFYCVGKVL